MARSHAHRSHQVEPNRPSAPAPPAEEVVPPLAGEETDAASRGSGLYVAMAIWMVGFFALLLWVVFDLILGILRQQSAWP
jgi:hypothetical protein